MADDFLDTDENTALEDSNQSTEYDDLISYIEKKYTLGRIRFRFFFRGSDPDPVFFIEGRICIRVNHNRIRNPAPNHCRPIHKQSMKVS